MEYVSNPIQIVRSIEVYCNGRIRCPWHGACFSVETGDIEDFPETDSIHRFQATIEQKDGVNHVKVR